MDAMGEECTNLQFAEAVRELEILNTYHKVVLDRDIRGKTVLEFR